MKPMQGQMTILNDPTGQAHPDDILPGVRKHPDPARPMEGRHHHPGTDTERAAARRVRPRSGTQRASVLRALELRGAVGVSDYELWSLFKIGARPHVPATRREELIADGWPIVDSGERRQTDTGALAIVWRLEQ